MEKRKYAAASRLYDSGPYAWNVTTFGYATSAPMGDVYMINKVELKH